ncbi:MAG TPA: SUKH-4 family immunity protein [Bacillota bacterium]|nr:SUKH-4 family immunity protein [Bacillota bacterium]
MTVRFWSNHTFLEYTEEELAVSQLPEEISHFLLRFGLPEAQGSFAVAGIKFYPAAEFYEVIDDFGTYTVIGKLVENILAIHNTTGEVYFFAPDETVGSRVYVNLNVQLFLIFHQMFYEELEKSADGFENGSTYPELVQKLKSKFSVLDPLSVEQLGNFWDRLFAKFETVLI